MARRAPEHVGALIADENALLYGVPRERVLAASVLRARAGRLRDEGGERADWPRSAACSSSPPARARGPARGTHGFGLTWFGRRPAHRSRSPARHTPIHWSPSRRSTPCLA
jgi:hypothetical protein